MPFDGLLIIPQLVEHKVHHFGVGEVLPFVFTVKVFQIILIDESENFVFDIGKIEFVTDLFVNFDLRSDSGLSEKRREQFLFVNSFTGLQDG